MKTRTPPPLKRRHPNAGKLTTEQKVYVVRRLATWDSPTAIVRDLADVFGVEVSKQAVIHYNPELASRWKLAPCWQELFRETREAYVAACANVGTMAPTVRVRLREDMVLMARDAGHYEAANELLDSIAREAGQWFVDRPARRLAPTPAPRAAIDGGRS